MATHEISVLGPMTAPDTSGGVFFEPLEAAMTLGTAAFGTTLGLTMVAPTGADIGVYGVFTIPQNYVGTPVLVIRGVIDEAANTLGFGIQFINLADSGAVDVAYDTEDTASNATWTGYAAEDVYEETITLTPAAAFAAGQQVFFFCYRDDSVDTQTGEFHLTSLHFRYADA